MDGLTVITIDFTDCRYYEDFQERIRTAFGFPEWYGKNWDAFWDLIDGMRDNTHVQIKGTATLSEELQVEITVMTEILQNNIQGLQQLKHNVPHMDCRFSYEIIN